MHVSTLMALPVYVATQDIRAPTLLIVGGVVHLHKKLNWYSGRSQ